jgi:hypothetical protein
MRRCPEGDDHLDQVAGLADGNDLPVFLSPELGEREPVRHLHSVLVLRGNSPAAEDGEYNRNNKGTIIAAAEYRRTALAALSR